MNIIAWLRTPIATLIVLCAALLAQLPHAADVFRMIVVGEGWLAILHGYAYAVALELAVLLFVVQRRNFESYVFAGVSVLVNLSYYSLHGINLFSPQALPAWLVSIALPAAIARYSHLLVESPQSAPAADAEPAQTDTQPDTATAQAADAEPAQTDTQPDTATAQAADAEPAQTAPQPKPQAAPQQRSTPARKRKPAKLEPSQRQAQIAEQQLTTAAQVQAQFGVCLRTAQKDLAAVREGLLTQNGVQHA